MENFINNAPFALVLVCLVIGFVLLIKGADFFVEGSSSAAKRLHVPSIIIGLTIVAMGTSLPETAVSVSASLTGNNELAVSNVIGSNIFNLMVVIGVCAVLTTVEVAKETIKRDIPLSLICAGPGRRDLNWILCRLHCLHGSDCIKGKPRRKKSRN